MQAAEERRMALEKDQLDQLAGREKKAGEVRAKGGSGNIMLATLLY